MSTDLTFCTDDELVDELAKRYQHGLIVSGVRDARGDSNSTDEARQSWYRNGLIACIGLATAMQRSMIRIATGEDEQVTE